MRLAFPDGEHDEVSVGKGTLSLGSSADDNVVLNVDGVEPGHAVIIVDRRGITLNVEVESGQVQVNGRPVIERAILRLGDRMAIGPVKMVLRAELDEIQPPPEGAERPAPAHSGSSKYHLRGLAGYHRGRIIPIVGPMSVGQGEACDLVIPDEALAPEQVRIDLDGNDIYARPANEDALDVNGIQVSDVILNPGDQLTIGAHRFLLETPGFVPGKAYLRSAAQRPASNTQVFASPVIGEQSESTREVAQEEAFDTQPGARDAIVVAVCVLLSAAMLVWLFFLS